MSSPNPESPRSIDDSDGPNHVVEVRQRLAHSHEHNVVDLFAALALNCDDLIDNFVWLEVPAESFEAARAKFAAVGAANLR